MGRGLRGPLGTPRWGGAKVGRPQLLPFSSALLGPAGPGQGPDKLTEVTLPISGPHQPQDPRQVSSPLSWGHSRHHCCHFSGFSGPSWRLQDSRPSSPGLSYASHMGHQLLTQRSVEHHSVTGGVAETPRRKGTCHRLPPLTPAAGLAAALRPAGNAGPARGATPHPSRPDPPATSSHPVLLRWGCAERKTPAP